MNLESEGVTMPKHLWQRVVLALCLCALASVAFFVLKYSLGRSDAGKVEEAKEIHLGLSPSPGER